MGGYGVHVKVGTLWIQAPHHRPEHTYLYSLVWMAIHFYPFHNWSLDLMIGLRIISIGWGNKGLSHEGNVVDQFLIHYRWSC